VWDCEDFRVTWFGCRWVYFMYNDLGSLTCVTGCVHKWGIVITCIGN